MNGAVNVLAVMDKAAEILVWQDETMSGDIAGACAAVVELCEASSDILCEVRDRSEGKKRLSKALARVRGEA